MVLVLYVHTTFCNFHTWCFWLYGGVLQLLVTWSCFVVSKTCMAILLGVILHFYVTVMYNNAHLDLLCCTRPSLYFSPWAPKFAHEFLVWNVRRPRARIFHCPQICLPVNIPLSFSILYVKIQQKNHTSLINGHELWSSL